LFCKNISKGLFNSLLGAAAGVMLAATAFSLLVPASITASNSGPAKACGWYRSHAARCHVLHFADERLPHLHFDSVSDASLNSLQKISLFIIAIHHP